MIKTCRELTIHNFNEISIDISNVVLLLEDGENAGEDELISAWYGILDEYHALLGDRNYVSKLKGKAELHVLKTQVKNLKILLDLSEQVNSEETIKKAEQLCKGYKTVFVAKRLNAKIKALELKIKIKSQSKESEKQGATLTDTIIMISKYAGYHLDKKKVFMDELIAYINQFKKDNKPKPTNKRGRR